METVTDQPVPVCPGQLDLLADTPEQQPVRDMRLPPFQAHSRTSREAALSMYSSLIGRRAEVYAYIAEHGPVTDLDIAAGLGRDGSSVRPRRIELFELGLITQAGEATTRSGRKAVTWKVEADG